jgi:hypothetical protein
MFLLIQILFLNQDYFLNYTPVVESSVIVVRHAPVKDWNDKEFKRE